MTAQKGMSFVLGLERDGLLVDRRLSARPCAYSRVPSLFADAPSASALSVAAKAVDDPASSGCTL